MFFIIGYADPGAGALIWQFLAALGIGCVFYLRSFISFIKSKVFKRKDS